MSRYWPWLAAIFLLPLLFAVAAGLFGIEVSSRDDLNYLAELEERAPIGVTLDALSWFFLAVVTWAFGLSSLSLRVVGLLVGMATVVVLMRRKGGLTLTSLFIISILPLYFTIYFNQLRLAIAMLFFIMLVTDRRLKFLAIPVGALAHTSLLLLVFPPLALLFPLGFVAVSKLDPESFAAIKLMAYLGAESTQMPWYFGWELVGIASILAMRKKWLWVAEVLTVIWSTRMIGADFSLEIARRILEIGMLAYSPFFLATQRGFSPTSPLVYYYLLLGVLQTTLSLRSGVIQL